MAKSSRRKQRPTNHISRQILGSDKKEFIRFSDGTFYCHIPQIKQYIDINGKPALAKVTGQLIRVKVNQEQVAA